MNEIECEVIRKKWEKEDNFPWEVVVVFGSILGAIGFFTLVCILVWYLTPPDQFDNPKIVQICDKDETVMVPYTTTSYTTTVVCDHYRYEPR